ncbi:magnesium/cobalt transporter CorA [Tengunoibacter tsumagoiensis]|uniref:Magnesium transport protein CorA n=1 Tax=Tengunoibacter tsumagoiensis TaxID=2014871 RepID=A0A401ZYX4_9CHLR|nr:magnesium/cobalt transporter CorA [Tengunoibacter tsumagoiensis]GCE12045.1 magnesium transport protein CorA [Tengunoibacter tsumagoiensis]
MQQLFIWHNGTLTADASVEEIHTALEDKQAVIWLDLQVDGNLAKYRDLLSSVFKLAPITIESMEEQKERSRLVEHHTYFNLVLHGLTFQRETVEASTPKIDIAFGHNFLITVHREEMSWLSGLLNAARSKTTEEHLLAKGVPRLLHAILDSLVDSYFPILDDIDDLIDELEDAAVEKANTTVQSQIFNAKRTIATMRRVISPQVEVSNALIMRTGDFIPGDVEPYFSDVHDHLVRTFEILDSYRDLLSGLLDVYLSTVSNNLNVIMKQLAIISTIFLPITFITGVFGQNFGHSPLVEHDNGYNFWYVLGFMLIISLIQIWYFHHRRWI